ncbi:unnamed protein product [Blepharisma stoltei]|uniref:UDENN domain-containing protein n=1 Tax=Blepharisma stoltei TaxID=1481888 RepID=A0AAU9K009_9CILI|nr:unnamed protein product [Blepharisma stoltei]
MDVNEMYWEFRYNALHGQYVQLKEEYHKLKEAYQQSLEANLKEFHTMKQIQEDNLLLKKQLEEANQKLQKTATNDKNTENFDDFAKTLCSKWPRIVNSIPLFSPQGGLSDRIEDTRPSSPDFSTEKVQSISGKTPQVNPDQSVAYDNIEPSMFEALFIVGPSKSQLGNAMAKPEILYEFGGSTIGLPIRRVIADFCFPTGIELRPIRHSGSESEFNNLIYGQTNSANGNNCYIFTLRSEGNVDGWVEYTDLPNSNREVIFCICMQIEDVAIEELSSVLWIVPKVLCIMSYIPIFELHFEVLKNLVMLKRLKNMENADNDMITHKLSQVEMSEEQIALMKTYSDCESVYPNLKLVIDIPSLNSINYCCAQDLSLIDIVWLCTPLFTSLKLQEVLWLLSALIQEKSVVFVSYNLGQLTSCVLGLQALLRPFKWPHLLIPLIPDSLRELLEAPVPLLAGLPGTAPASRRNMVNVIWVLLDEPNQIRRIQGPKLLIQEVHEPNEFYQSKELSNFASVFTQERVQFTPTPEQRNSCLEIAKFIKSYWLKILGLIHEDLTKNFDALQVHIIDSSPKGDHLFLNGLMQTQIFINSLEEKFVCFSVCIILNFSVWFVLTFW